MFNTCLLKNFLFTIVQWNLFSRLKENFVSIMESIEFSIGFVEIDLNYCTEKYEQNMNNLLFGVGLCLHLVGNHHDPLMTVFYHKPVLNQSTVSIPPRFFSIWRLDCSSSVSKEKGEGHCLPRSILFVCILCEEINILMWRMNKKYQIMLNKYINNEYEQMAGKRSKGNRNLRPANYK